MEPKDNLFSPFVRTLYEAVTDTGGGGGETSPAAEGTGAEAPPAAGGADPSPGDGSPEAPAAAETAEDNVFRIEDVPEGEAREHVERLQRQFQAALSRARQEDRSQIADQMEAIRLFERLNDPEQVEDVLNELADKHGLEPVPPTETTPAEGEENLTPEQREIKERLERMETAEQERRQERLVARLREHVREGIEKLADENGNVDPTRERLATFAALSQKGEDGLPDVAHAVELVEAVEAAAIQRFIASKSGSAPAPDASGSTGIPQVDTSTEKGRMEAAMKIAGRHLGASS